MAGKQKLLVSVLFFVLCSSAAMHLTPQTTSWTWPTATADEQHLRQKPLDELVRLIRQGKRYPRLHSLLIVRNGHLVVEEYFAGYSRETLHTLQSVSKSFSSALIGIALSRGDIKSVEEKVLDFFPKEIKIDNLDERKAAITIEDLLTMRSGTDYHERSSRSPHFQLNKLKRGWDTFYLNRPMVSQPGTEFLYDSGGVILLSSLLKSRTGAHADVYAEQLLFKPLQVREHSWFKNEEGHPHLGGGLHLKPLDMAKLGQLYLQKGRWQGQQIVPSWWVEESLQQHVSFPTTTNNIVGYGYLWWVLAPDPGGSGKHDIYAAMGFRAQYIFIIPEHELVVVVTGDTQNGIDQRKPIGFLYSHILPAVSAMQQER
jgi:CubicO group peptidase (beta-lactamase class C family)